MTRLDRWRRGSLPVLVLIIYRRRVELASLLIEALQLALWLATPALLACVCVAALTSVLQGALQASDPSIGFVPKLFAVLGTLWVTQSYLAERLAAFAGKLFQAMARL